MYIINKLKIDDSLPWYKWNWKKVRPITSYEWACLEEYRDSTILTYKLYNEIGMAHILELLRAKNKDVKILDAGGGTGRKAIPLAKLGFNNITLLDHAKGWLKLAKEKAKKENINCINFIESDILNMNMIQSNSYDYVFAMGGVVSYCNNSKGALEEITRVLKPGGKLIADGIHQLNEIGHPTYPLISSKELRTITSSLELKDINIYSEFINLPEDTIKLSEVTSNRFNEYIKKEMNEFKDPKYLDKRNLILFATKV